MCGGAVELAVPAGDNRWRHVCSSCAYVDYQNPKLVVGAIVEHEGRVLLCRRGIEPQKVRGAASLAAPPPPPPSAPAPPSRCCSTSGPCPLGSWRWGRRRRKAPSGRRRRRRQRQWRSRARLCTLTSQASARCLPAARLLGGVHSITRPLPRTPTNRPPSNPLFPDVHPLPRPPGSALHLCGAGARVAGSRALRPRRHPLGGAGLFVRVHRPALLAGRPRTGRRAAAPRLHRQDPGRGAQHPQLVPAGGPLPGPRPAASLLLVSSDSWLAWGCPRSRPPPSGALAARMCPSSHLKHAVAAPPSVKEGRASRPRLPPALRMRLPPRAPDVCARLHAPPTDSAAFHAPARRARGGEGAGRLCTQHLPSITPPSSRPCATRIGTLAAAWPGPW